MKRSKSLCNQAEEMIPAPEWTWFWIQLTLFFSSITLPPVLTSRFHTLILVKINAIFHRFMRVSIEATFALALLPNPACLLAPVSICEMHSCMAVGLKPNDGVSLIFLISVSGFVVTEAATWNIQRRTEFWINNCSLQYICTVFEMVKSTTYITVLNVCTFRLYQGVIPGLGYTRFRLYQV